MCKAQPCRCNVQVRVLFLKYGTVLRAAARGEDYSTVPYRV